MASLRSFLKFSKAVRYTCQRVSVWLNTFFFKGLGESWRWLNVGVRYISSLVLPTNREKVLPTPPSPPYMVGVAHLCGHCRPDGYERLPTSHSGLLTPRPPSSLVTCLPWPDSSVPPTSETLSTPPCSFQRFGLAGLATWTGTPVEHFVRWG